MNFDDRFESNNEQLNVFDQLDTLNEQENVEEIEKEPPMQETLAKVYEALCEKGYDPARQIAGYILSEDPVYITNWNNARGLIGHINRDDLLVELIRSYLKIEPKKEGK